MRRALFFIAVLCCANCTFAQQNIYIPADKTNNASDIAAFVNNHYHSDDEKISAIYNWITNNIKYDADSMHYVILDEDNDQRVSVALRRKRGVCENFAAVFNDLCNKCGIQSFAIEGYTRQTASIDRTPHMWCAAFADGEWYLYDPTWDAGYIRNGGFINHVQNNYFKISPHVFIQTHLPFDPMLQFLNYPVTYKEFINGKTGEQSEKNYFNYKDSIDAFRKMNPLDQYLSEMNRIKKSNWPASKIDTKLKRIRLELEVRYQDKDVALYDSSVADYNKAINYLNTFLSYRNNQFQPAKSNEEVQKLFLNIRNLIADANAKLKQVNLSDATLTLNTGDLQQKLDELLVNVKQHENFLKNQVSQVK
ncbi:MAG: transglutaminase domain-containing protein [Ginsengibacter sp.]